MCSTCQRYKMKGNHNPNQTYLQITIVVFNMSKIQNERKSQQEQRHLINTLCCVQHVKDTKWKEITTYVTVKIVGLRLCSTCQRYKMKGNHNRNVSNKTNRIVVFNMSKIQNERKSQLLSHLKVNRICCVQHVKDTKWKEITTYNLNFYFYD